MTMLLLQKSVFWGMIFMFQQSSLFWWENILFVQKQDNPCEMLFLCYFTAIHLIVCLESHICATTTGRLQSLTFLNLSLRGFKGTRFLRLGCWSRKETRSLSVFLPCRLLPWWDSGSRLLRPQTGFSWWRRPQVSWAGRLVRPSLPGPPGSSAQQQQQQQQQSWVMTTSLFSCF